MSDDRKIDLVSNDEVLEFVKSNIDRLPVCYMLLVPYKATVSMARISVNSSGVMQTNLGVFYKPISDIINE